jgi:hypothetical protein
LAGSIQFSLRVLKTERKYDPARRVVVGRVKNLDSGGAAVIEFRRAFSI